MSKNRTLLGRLSRLLLIKLPLAFFVLTFLWALILRWCPIYVNPLMIQRTIEYRGDKNYYIHKTWVQYKRISPEMARAVIASEDNLFDKNSGFEWKAIKKAQEEYERGKRSRGGRPNTQTTGKKAHLVANQ